jgi:hypothetical protein
MTKTQLAILVLLFLAVAIGGAQALQRGQLTITTLYAGVPFLLLAFLFTPHGSDAERIRRWAEENLAESPCFRAVHAVSGECPCCRARARLAAQALGQHCAACHRDSVRARLMLAPAYETEHTCRIIGPGRRET